MSRLQAGSCCRTRCCFPAANICPSTCGFQRSTAAALCDLTTEVLRTINATENAVVELGLSEPAQRPHLVGTDVKQADDAFRELEENVYMAAGQSYELESKLRKLEHSAKNHIGGTTDSELSELEDVVALTAARVQSAESEANGAQWKSNMY
ncbi:hypothetical protein INR49_008807 [Caranx melampygus]|nr:hypothetical protein INR49_008807 [Caranx melampygus]